MTFNGKGMEDVNDQTLQNAEVSDSVKKKSRDIESLVGKKIKLFRQLRGLSQSEISNQLGITFQQFQKYESGKNRIPISRLMKLAEIFKVTMSVFFESTVNVMFENVQKTPSLNEGVHQMSTHRDISFSASGKETQEDEDVSVLINNFKKIKDSGVRKHVLMLVTSLSDSQSN